MLNVNELAWKKMNGLIPAVVQDAFDGRVLMQGYMNPEALNHSLESGQVTFFSRSRQTLWTKGETSGNFLELVDVIPDCDGDCLLVQARPAGPVCHLGTTTCFPSDEPTHTDLAFLAELERVIKRRDIDRPEGSYTTRLLDEGIQRIAQKVGEEGVETALAAVAGTEEELLDESAEPPQPGGYTAFEARGVRVFNTPLNPSKPPFSKGRLQCKSLPCEARASNQLRTASSFQREASKQISPLGRKDFKSATNSLSLPKGGFNSGSTSLLLLKKGD
jgi:phosphoribosyl-ATP pyrophosphohydrolase/phosphoribosyl-AMP cyclohydrolase